MTRSYMLNQVTPWCKYWVVQLIGWGTCFYPRCQLLCYVVDTLCFISPICLVPNYYEIEFWSTLLGEFLHFWSCHEMSKCLVQSVALYLLCNSSSQSTASQYVTFSTNLSIIITLWPSFSGNISLLISQFLEAEATFISFRKNYWKIQNSPLPFLFDWT